MSELSPVQFAFAVGADPANAASALRHLNAVFDRDAYHFTLNGSMNLLAPVNGTTFGAVFVGTAMLLPALSQEPARITESPGRHHLR